MTTTTQWFGTCSGSRASYVRFDGVAVDLAESGAYTPTTLGYDPKVTFNTTKPPAEIDEVFAGVPTCGLLYQAVGGFDKPESPFTSYFRGLEIDAFQWAWAEVALANGKLRQLPNGDYRALLRALTYGSDWHDENRYESWLSPIIRVNITDPGYPNSFLKWNNGSV